MYQVKKTARDLFRDSQPYIVMAASPRKTYLLALKIAVFAAVIEVICSQTVSVSIAPEVSQTSNGTEQTLSCSFSVTGTGYTLDDLQWLKESDSRPAVLIADFFGGAANPRHPNPDYPASDYPVMRTDSVTNLNISVARYDKDGGIYSCRVDYAQGFNIITDTSSANLTVYVGNGLRVATNFGDFSMGDDYPAQVGQELFFELIVEEAYPPPSFSWTLGEKDLPSSKDPNPVKDQQTGLYTATSNVTFAPEISDNGKDLKCEVIYVQGLQGTELTIARLVVTEPPQPSTTSTPPPGGLPIWAIILIVVGGVALIVVVAVGIYCCCKNNEESHDPTCRSEGREMDNRTDGDGEKRRLEKNGTDLT